MTTLEMGDSSTPPASTSPLPAYAFYIGGDTPHTWTDAEYEAIESRWVLPIWVNTNPQADAAAHAAAITGWLHGHGFARGETVAVDTETAVMPAYLTQLDQLIKAAGFALMDYESKGPAPDNPVCSGGRWAADWTGQPHLYPGSVATQYADASMAGTPWDCSLVDASVVLHELHPPVVRTITTTAVSLTLPVLVTGDNGPAVRRMQHLLVAADAQALPRYGCDGIFGAETQGALGAFQRLYGLTPPTRIADGPTWTRLAEG